MAWKKLKSRFHRKVFLATALASLVSDQAIAEILSSAGLGLEFDSNVWDLSRSEIRDIEQDPDSDPDIKSTDDWITTAWLRVRAKRDTENRNSFDLNLEAFNYRRNQNLDYWRTDISWRRKLGKGRNIWLAYTHTPNQFLGSYDNGDTIVRDRISKQSINLKYSSWFNRRNAGLIEFRYGEDDYSADTPGLDANIYRLRGSWLYRHSAKVQLKSSLLFQARKPVESVDDSDAAVCDRRKRVAS